MYELNIVHDNFSSDIYKGTHSGTYSLSAKPDRMKMVLSRGVILVSSLYSALGHTPLTFSMSWLLRCDTPEHVNNIWGTSASYSITRTIALFTVGNSWTPISLHRQAICSEWFWRPWRLTEYATGVIWHIWWLWQILCITQLYFPTS